MIPSIIDAARLHELVSIPDAVRALADLFAGPRPATPHRTSVAGEAGDVLVMAAHWPPATGVKVLGVAPGNPQAGLPVINGAFVLLDAQTLRLRSWPTAPR
jgi:ornithine cyclodeaminase/alanine dehydrogenase-like protein (mu-crystallin family)